MRNYIWLLIIFTTSWSQIGLSSNGTRGGGETVVVQNQKRLRDLMEPTNCKWVSGNKVYSQYPSIEKILKAIETVDWHFAASLRTEIRSLNYCFTRYLRPVRTEDFDAVTIVVTTETKQAGIRSLNNVYVDKTEVDALSPMDQGLFFTHESMHSYLPWYIPQRNQKVRSMVGVIYDLVSGTPMSRDDFHYQMSNNSVQFPQNVEALEEHRQQVSFMLADHQYKSVALRSIKNFDQFLSDYDSKNVTAAFENYVSHLCIAGDNNNIAWLAGQETLTQVNVAAICLSVNSVWSNQELMQIILRSSSFQSLKRFALEPLVNKALNFNGLRLMATGFERLSKTPESQEPVRFTELESLSQVNGVKEMNATMKGYFNVIADALKKKDNNVTNSLLNSQEFDEAFEINSAREKINSTLFYFPAEKKLALEKLDLLTYHFWNAVLNQLTLRKVNAAELNYFIKVINNKNLGFKI